MNFSNIFQGPCSKRPVPLSFEQVRGLTSASNLANTQIFGKSVGPSVHHMENPYECRKSSDHRFAGKKRCQTTIAPPLLSSPYHVAKSSDFKLRAASPHGVPAIMSYVSLTPVRFFARCFPNAFRKTSSQPSHAKAIAYSDGFQSSPRHRTARRQCVAEVLQTKSRDNFG